MKMKNVFQTILSVFFLLFCATACKKEAINTTSPTKETFNVEAKVRSENGRLVFADVKHYHKTMEEIGKMDEQQLTAWEAQFSYNSLQSQFRQSESRDGLDLPFTVRYLLNTKREVIVGSQILRYVDGKVYRVDSNGNKTPEIVSSYSFVKIQESQPVPESQWVNFASTYGPWSTVQERRFASNFGSRRFLIAVRLFREQAASSSDAVFQAFLWTTLQARSGSISGNSGWNDYLWENRELVMNVTGGASFYYDVSTPNSVQSFLINKVVSNPLVLNGQNEQLLGSLTTNTAPDYQKLSNWADFTLAGSIEMKVVGGPASQRQFFTGYPIW